MVCLSLPLNEELFPTSRLLSLLAFTCRTLRVPHSASHILPHSLHTPLHLPPSPLLSWVSLHTSHLSSPKCQSQKLTFFLFPQKHLVLLMPNCVFLLSFEEIILLSEVKGLKKKKKKRGCCKSESQRQQAWKEGGGYGEGDGCSGTIDRTLEKRDSETPQGFEMEWPENSEFLLSTSQKRWGCVLSDMLDWRCWWDFKEKLLLESEYLCPLQIHMLKS